MHLRPKPPKLYRASSFVARAEGQPDRTALGEAPPPPVTTVVSRGARAVSRTDSGTPAHPDVEQLLTGMSVLLEFMIREEPEPAPPSRRGGRGRPEPGALFCAPPSEVVEWPIAAEEIWRFAARLHKICMWTPECLVVSLLFLIRYLSYTPSVVLHARNWRRLVFTATMVAQKYWDDRSLKNADFPKVWRYVCKKSERISIQQVNAMEVEFLIALDFDLNVSRQAYISCFIEICALAPNASGATVRAAGPPCLHAITHERADGEGGAPPPGTLSADALRGGAASVVTESVIGSKTAPRSTEYDEWQGVHTGPDSYVMPCADPPGRPPMRRMRTAEVLLTS